VTAIAQVRAGKAGAGLHFSAPLLLALAALAIHLLVADGAWQWDRAAISQGQWWRILTGHWAHWNTSHLVWDAAAFAVLGLVCRPFGKVGWWACVGGAALVIGATVYFAMPGMLSYRGLSGIDSALFGYAAICLLIEHASSRPWRWAISLVLASFGLKVLLETLLGKALFAGDLGAGIAALPAVHVIGLLWGMGVASCRRVPSELWVFLRDRRLLGTRRHGGGVGRRSWRTGI
jgi:rhomboid family GlyGly-CTERM serine protease